MNTLLIVIASIVAVAALVLICAYISVLLDDIKHYKMLAERWEEAYFEKWLEGSSSDGAGAMAYWASLEKGKDGKELQYDVMNGIDKHLY